MNALQAMKINLNVAHTENGDLAYKSTGSACLDFFSLCGGMRRNVSDLSKLFVKAFAEEPVVAIKILFYMRNIRGGLPCSFERACTVLSGNCKKDFVRSS